MTASEAPRYDSITDGWCNTSWGGPAVIIRPWSRATSRSEMAVMRGMSCSMMTTLAPSSSRMRSSRGANASVSRWAIPLDGSSSSTTLG